jgi:hypothetical protein
VPYGQMYSEDENEERKEEDEGDYTTDAALNDE